MKANESSTSRFVETPTFRLERHFDSKCRWFPWKIGFLITSGFGDADQRLQGKSEFFKYLIHFQQLLDIVPYRRCFWFNGKSNGHK